MKNSIQKKTICLQLLTTPFLKSANSAYFYMLVILESAVQ